MLDRRNSEFTADNPDFPRPEVERMGSPGARRRGRMEDVRAQGKLRSHIKVISDANWVNLTIRNTETKTVIAIAWDFAFPRYVEGRMALRYEVTSKVEIKPGGKKTLKEKLPAGATRCKTVTVGVDEEQGEKAKTFEAVCGPGVHDPSHLKQETVSIKRIEYEGGSVWQKHASTAGQAQTTTAPAAAENKASAGKPPVEIISHKIGAEYYPMLDRPSLTSPPIAAEDGNVPLTENERIAGQQRNRSNKNVAAPIAPEDSRSRGRLRSYMRVIDDAQSVQVVVQNTADRPIKIVEWDFAFPRYEGGQLLSRYDVTTKIEIKPGGKKTLKHKLPPGAKRCEVVKVVSDENEPEKVSTFEAVCGRGFHDPSLLGQRQETISIKRIEYIDGSVWRRQ
jgi:hypothetical protein